MTSSDHDRARREIVQTALLMVSGAMDLVAGSRRLCSLRHEIDAGGSALFLPIADFASDTDVHPIGNVRAYYNENYLKELDRELEGYLELAKPDLLAACKRIIESLSEGG